MTPRPPAAQAVRTRVVTDFDTTLLLEAGAGPGKTTVLVSRILALLRKGKAPIDRIVAITFTEKAAGELKSRLRDEIERALEEAGQRAGEGAATELERRPPHAEPERALDHVFHLLELALDKEAVLGAREALRARRPLRGTALEYLGNVLPERLRRALQPLLGEGAALTGARPALDLERELRGGLRGEAAGIRAFMDQIRLVFRLPDPGWACLG